MAEFDEDAVRESVRKTFTPSHEYGPSKYELAPGSSIKHVVGIISGKGGVGKSMVTSVLATQLAKSGYSVGILDADITGPSIPRMFGMAGKLMTAVGDMIQPCQSEGGIKVVSTNLLLANESDPVLWRGPILMGAIKQFYEQADWGELDFLLVDMPPGTGDVALTVFQSLPIDGVVIVSSPQDLVQMVVGKAVNMAKMMDVPVLGLVENMSYMACPHCGEPIELFGPSKLDESAKEFSIPALGKMPIDPTLAAAADAGTFEDAATAELPPAALAELTRLI